MVADYEKRITRDSGPAKIINFHVFSKSASCSTTARRKKGCRRESICCPPEIQGKYAEWLLFRPCCALISHQALLSNIIRQAFGEYHNRVVTSEAQLLVIRIMFEPGRRTLLNGRWKQRNVECSQCCFWLLLLIHKSVPNHRVTTYRPKFFLFNAPQAKEFRWQSPTRTSAHTIGAQHLQAGEEINVFIFSLPNFFHRRFLPSERPQRGSLHNGSCWSRICSNYRANRTRSHGSRWANQLTLRPCGKIGFF